MTAVALFALSLTRGALVADLRSSCRRLGNVLSATRQKGDGGVEFYSIP